MRLRLVSYISFCSLAFNITLLLRGLHYLLASCLTLSLPKLTTYLRCRGPLNFHTSKPSEELLRNQVCTTAVVLYTALDVDPKSTVCKAYRACSAAESGGTAVELECGAVGHIQKRILLRNLDVIPCYYRRTGRVSAGEPESCRGP